jgi:hypothetical protein
MSINYFKKLKFLFFLIFLLVNFQGEAQTPVNNFSENNFDTLSFLEKAPSPYRKRIRTLNYSIPVAYTLSMAWLYSQWYSNYEQTSFHFFNDNDEWEQMDKVGHFWDAYNISKPMMHCYRWAGFSEKKATWYGVGIAFAFQTTIEVFDGFSSEWGFSWGDIAANTGGVALFAAQQFGWHEQRIVLKYSFHQTEYSQYNPDLLGNTLPENILKDYNGLTYWATVNPRSFWKNSFFPRWFSVAFGYGAEGMTGGEENPTTVDGVDIPAFDRYRQFYLSIDFDLARIQTKSQLLSSIFKMINIIHLPSPAIEWSSGRKPVYHALYF